MDMKEKCQNSIGCDIIDLKSTDNGRDGTQAGIMLKLRGMGGTDGNVRDIGVSRDQVSTFEVAWGNGEDCDSITKAPLEQQEAANSDQFDEDFPSESEEKLLSDGKLNLISEDERAKQSTGGKEGDSVGNSLQFADSEQAASISPAGFRHIRNETRYVCPEWDKIWMCSDLDMDTLQMAVGKHMKEAVPFLHGDDFVSETSQSDGDHNNRSLEEEREVSMPDEGDGTNILLAGSNREACCMRSWSTYRWVELDNVWNRSDLEVDKLQIETDARAIGKHVKGTVPVFLEKDFVSVVSLSDGHDGTGSDRDRRKEMPVAEGDGTSTSRGCSGLGIFHISSRSWISLCYVAIISIYKGGLFTSHLRGVFEMADDGVRLVLVCLYMTFRLFLVLE